MKHMKRHNNKLNKEHKDKMFREDDNNKFKLISINKN